jgi:flagellar protein FliS
MAMTNYQANTYKQTGVKTAGQGKIIVMLYDEVIKQLSTAITLLGEENKKLDTINNAILKSKDIITELMVSLDMEKGGDFSQRMFSLYMWFNNQLMEANLRKDTKPLKTVRDFMVEIRGAWAEASQKASVPEPRDSSGVNIAG